VVGQTGMGGGALMTPLLILLFGNPATAVGTDLLYASATKTVGTLLHGFNHTVRWHIVALLAMGSVLATALTLLVISKIDLSGTMVSDVIGNVLGVLLLLTSLSLFFRGQFLAFAGTRLLAIGPKQTTFLTVTTGAVLGVLVTISSVGAGALGVTALLLLFPRLPMAIIVGSDIAHAVPLTLVAGVGHWFLGSVDWATAHVAADRIGARHNPRQLHLRARAGRGAPTNPGDNADGGGWQTDLIARATFEAVTHSRRSGGPCGYIRVRMRAGGWSNGYVPWPLSENSLTPMRD
jgi:uncharacterized protein